MLRRPRSLWEGLVFGAPCDGGQMIDLLAPSVTPTKHGTGTVSSVDGVNGRAATAYPTAAPNANYEWPYRPSFSTVAGEATMSLLIRPTVDNGAVQARCFWVGSSTYMGIRRGTAGTWQALVGATQLSQAPTATIGNWYHLAVVVIGGEAYTHFRDLGTGQFTSGRTSLSTPIAAIPSATAIAIGASPGGTTNPMYADVQTACLWNRALTIDELNRVPTWDFRS